MHESVVKLRSKIRSHPGTSPFMDLCYIELLLHRCFTTKAFPVSLVHCAVSVSPE